MAATHDVHLVGVNHKYQLGPDGIIPVDAPAEAFTEFRHLLTSTIARAGIRGIAEEMSRFALKKHFIAGDSVPCHVASESGLPHRYCDPDPAMQKALGIVSDSQREQYWIKELLAFDTFPVLFVLGADHIDAFQRMLIESGLQPFVVAPDWEPSSDANDAI
jgi:hypothetical protein